MENTYFIKDNVLFKNGSMLLECDYKYTAEFYTALDFLGVDFNNPVLPYADFVVSYKDDNKTVENIDFFL